MKSIQQWYRLVSLRLVTIIAEIVVAVLSIYSLFVHGFTQSHTYAL